ncbi:MAG TPA: isoleucine--tRNA ligase [Mycobacteriales bacterium]|nr:isoleucine--tRNA ligase [Mycobacteriales bacterium]
MSYPKDDPTSAVTGQPAFPELERAILDFWQRDDTFVASVEARAAGPDGANEYVFYDGPPFANGLPHYGHLLTGFIKDVVPRYQTMRGRRVERRFGWDTHGLPAEVAAERELGISGKRQIVELGVAAFNEHCRTSVLRYTREFQEYVTRQARWVDFEHGYKTLDLSYMESVLWAFGRLYEKGLIYEGFRVLAYCWRCETPLSNSETKLDDAYRDREDTTVTVAFELVSGDRLLVWTTTPWTLPSNLALAVGADIDYAVVEQAGTRYVVAESRLADYADELGDATRVGTVSGADLVGATYRPLFPYLADTAGAFRVLAADFVTAEDGTGIVHLAPAYGEDDQKACADAGIPTVLTVDERARFTELVPDYQGTQVFDANEPIIADLAARGALLRRAPYTHSYPHCWRCDTPLVYKAVTSWFVEVTKLRERMVELNQQIDWVPSHVRDGSFGKWLANAHDWSISRNRFWGSPIPVWKSDDPSYPRVDVYGSLDELQRDFGVRPTDLHRPAVDDLVRPNPDDPTGKSMMRRVPEVLDCWFESGSMPFAQVHYPFENADWFDKHYPGDFIVEYIGQTRAWFYNLHVLATALFDRPAFRTAVTHGVVLGDDGRKASKSRRNFPDPEKMFDLYGSDAVRWSLLSSPLVRGGEGALTETAIRDAARQAMLPLWNAWYFFALYANTGGHQARSRTDSPHLLDRYVLAKLHDLVGSVTGQLDAYDISAVCSEIREFLDVLCNWYIRRSRDRFWRADADAFDTLYTVLETLTRVAAPLLPMETERVWRGLTGGRSVHLTDWPSPADLPKDAALVSTMDKVREVCSAALSVRKAHKLRVRQPLASLTVAGPVSAGLVAFTELIGTEVNVKQVVLTGDEQAASSTNLKVVPRALGPRLGRDVQRVIAAVRSGDWSADGGTVVAGGVPLLEGEFTLEVAPAEGTAAAALPSGRGMVVLDTVATPELTAEGVARDAVRVVQAARREAGLEVADRIRLQIAGTPGALAALVTHRDLLAGETLATDVLLTGPVPPDVETAVAVGDGERVAVTILPA